MIGLLSPIMTCANFSCSNFSSLQGCDLSVALVCYYCYSQILTCRVLVSHPFYPGFPLLRARSARRNLPLLFTVSPYVCRPVFQSRPFSRASFARLFHFVRFVSGSVMRRLQGDPTLVVSSSILTLSPNNSDALTFKLTLAGYCATRQFLHCSSVAWL